MRRIIILIQLLLFIFIIMGCNNKEPETYEYEMLDVKVESGKFLVDGQLALPKANKKVPAIVIVAGSGPTDMDGTTNAQKPYKELAIKLAKKGIASIRYNKVNNQFLSSVAADYDFTIEDEYINSITSAINILKENEKINSKEIYLVGHSLGGQIIPIILNDNEELAGGIIMAGTTMHILDIILEQVRKQNEKAYQEYLPYCEYAKGLTEVPKGEEKYAYFGAYTAYYVEYNKINREIIKNLVRPLLIMQGELDLQVSMDHFNNYKELLENNDNVIYKQYPQLNHLFSNGENENIANAYMTYNPVSDDVITDIAEFIKGK